MTVRRLTPRRLLIGVTALPPLVLTVGSLAMVALASGGVDTVWRVAPGYNMSEAAALHDRPAIVRLIRSGEDPRVPRRVRAGLLAAGEVTLTPLEAAIAARRPEVVEVLLWESGGVDPDTWARLRCLTANDTGVVTVLERYRPDGAGAPCEEVAPR